MDLFRWAGAKVHDWAGAWKEWLHPRGPDGRFIDKWSMPEPAARKVLDILQSAKPHTFLDNKDAAAYAAARHQASPGAWEPRRYRLDYDNANVALARHRMDPTTQKFQQMMDGKATPLAEDTLVTVPLSPEMLNLGPDFNTPKPRPDMADKPGETAPSFSDVEGLTGSVVSSSGYTAGAIGDVLNAPQPIKMIVMAPKGTKVIWPGEGKSIDFPRGQAFRITRVEDSGRGGAYVYAVPVTPEAGEQRSLLRPPTSAAEAAARAGTPDQREAQVPEPPPIPQGEPGIPGNVAAPGTDMQARMAQPGFQQPQPGFQRPPRQEPLAAQAVGGPPQSTGGAPQVPEAGVAAGPERGAMTGMRFRRVYNDAISGGTLEIPTGSKERKQFFDAHRATISEKGDPENALRVLEADIRDDLEKARKTEDPQLQTDVRRLDDLAQLIADSYGFERSTGGGRPAEVGVPPREKQSVEESRALARGLDVTNAQRLAEARAIPKPTKRGKKGTAPELAPEHTATRDLIADRLRAGDWTNDRAAREADQEAARLEGTDPQSAGFYRRLATDIREGKAGVKQVSEAGRTRQELGQQQREFRKLTPRAQAKYLVDNNIPRDWWPQGLRDQNGEVDQARLDAVTREADRIERAGRGAAEATARHAPKKGDVVERRDGTLGEIVTIPRAGKATVQWHDGQKERGIDLAGDKNISTIRERRAGDVIEPGANAPVKRAVPKATEAKAAPAKAAPAKAAKRTAPKEPTPEPSRSELKSTTTPHGEVRVGDRLKVHLDDARSDTDATVIAIHANTGGNPDIIRVRLNSGSLKGEEKQWQADDAYHLRGITAVTPESITPVETPTPRPNADIESSRATVADLRAIARNEGVPRQSMYKTKAALRDAIRQHRTTRGEPTPEMPEAPRAAEAMVPQSERAVSFREALQKKRFKFTEAETRDSLASGFAELDAGRITPDQMVRTIEGNIETNNERIGEIEAHLRRLDVGPVRRGEMQQDLVNLEQTNKELKRASEWTRQYFSKEPVATPHEIDRAAATEISPSFNDQINSDTPAVREAIRQSAKDAGLGKVEGTTARELLQDSVKKAIAKDKADAKAGRKPQAPKKVEAPTPDEAPASGWQSPQAREIAAGLEVDPVHLDAIQRELDNPKKTPGAVARWMRDRFLNGGVSDPTVQASIANKLNDTEETRAALERANREKTALGQLADRLAKTRRSRATAPRPKPAELTPEEKKDAAHAADLAGVPESTVAKRMVERKEDSDTTGYEWAKGQADLIHAATTDEQVNDLLKGKTALELRRIARTMTNGKAGRSKTDNMGLIRDARLARLRRGDTTPAPGALTPEDQARVRQASIDDKRKTANLVRDIMGQVSDGADSPLLARTIPQRADVHGAPEDVRSRLLAANEAGRLDEELKAIAQENGIEIMHPAGDVVPFNPKTMSSLGKVDEGTPVLVMRPGTRFTPEGGTPVLDKATVIKAGPEDVTPLPRRTPGGEGASAEATQRANEFERLRGPATDYKSRDAIDKVNQVKNDYGRGAITKQEAGQQLRDYVDQIPLDRESPQIDDQRMLLRLANELDPLPDIPEPRRRGSGPATRGAMTSTERAAVVAGLDKMLADIPESVGNEKGMATVPYRKLLESLRDKVANNNWGDSLVRDWDALDALLSSLTRRYGGDVRHQGVGGGTGTRNIDAPSAFFGRWGPARVLAEGRRSVGSRPASKAVKKAIPTPGEPSGSVGGMTTAERLTPSMAVGKTNANRVQIGDQILVADLGNGKAMATGRKTGPSIRVLTVTGKGRISRGRTTGWKIVGTDENGNELDLGGNSSSQTFWTAESRAPRKAAEAVTKSEPAPAPTPKAEAAPRPSAAPIAPQAPEPETVTITSREPIPTGLRMQIASKLRNGPDPVLGPQALNQLDSALRNGDGEKAAKLRQQVITFLSRAGISDVERKQLLDFLAAHMS